MKKFIVFAVVAAMVLCMIGCGADYEQKGYEYAKSALDVAEAEAIAETGEATYKQSMQIGIALFGIDTMIVMLTPNPDSFPEKVGYTNMSNEEKTDFLAGVNSAVEEYVNSFAEK